MKTEKPTLKLETETIHTIEYHDLEEFVKQVYGVEDYEFVAIQECGNDSQHRFQVDGEIKGKYDQERSDRIRKGQINTYENRALMNTLCADGYIEPGIYIVDVCWWYMKWRNLNQEKPPEQKMLVIGRYNHFLKQVTIVNVGYFDERVDYWRIGGPESWEKYWKKKYYNLWAKV